MNSAKQRWLLTALATLAPALAAQDRAGSIYQPDQGAQSIIGALGGLLRRVQVTRVHNGTYFAELHLTRGGQPILVDSRPSDAKADLEATSHEHHEQQERHPEWKEAECASCAFEWH